MKTVKHILGIIAALLLVGFVTVPAGDILTGSFIILKGLNLIAFLIVAQLFELADRHQSAIRKSH